MNNSVKKEILIVGNTLEAFVAAFAISKQFNPSSYNITVLKDKEQDISNGVSLPFELLAGYSRLQISEKMLLENTNSSYKLGTLFQNWGDCGDVIQPLGTHGGQMDMVAFQSFAVKKRQSQPSLNYNDYALGAAAASESKFIHPQSNPGSILSTLAYSIHLDAHSTKDWFESACKKQEVSIISGEIEKVSVDDARTLTSIELAGGKSLKPNFVIDCSNKADNLFSDALSIEFENWENLVKFNKKISCKVEQGKIEKPLTIVNNSNRGILKAVPIGEDLLCDFYFSSSQLSDEKAASALESSLSEMISSEAAISLGKVENFAEGVRNYAWVGNYVALGKSYGQYLALDASNHYGFFVALERLVSLFPRGSDSEIVAYEFNRKTRLWYENMRDFNLMRVLRIEPLLNQDNCSNSLPESYRHKLELFTNSAQLAYFEEEPFAEHYRASAYINMGYWPESYDLLLDKFDFSRLESRFDEMKKTIKSTISNMPNHKDYLQRILSNK